MAISYALNNVIVARYLGIGTFKYPRSLIMIEGETRRHSVTVDMQADSWIFVRLAPVRLT